MPATAKTMKDFWPKNNMHNPNINNLCWSNAFFDIYNLTFIIAISPRVNNFKGIISKVPGGNSYCEGSIIDIKKRLGVDIWHTMSFQMA